MLCCLFRIEHLVNNYYAISLKNEIVLMTDIIYCDLDSGYCEYILQALYRVVVNS